jgi:hypothetical protein
LGGARLVRELGPNAHGETQGHPVISVDTKKKEVLSVVKV